MGVVNAVTGPRCQRCGCAGPIRIAAKVFTTCPRWGSGPETGAALISHGRANVYVSVIADIRAGEQGVLNRVLARPRRVAFSDRLAQKLSNGSAP